MPRTSVEDEEAALLRTGERRALRFWEGFTELAMHGNILQIALGMIFASMFTNLVTSLVSDVMLPPMSVLFPLNRNLEEKFAVLQSGPNRDPEVGYTTLKFALEDGAVVLAYGMFLSKLFHFLGVGLALYSFAMAYQYFSHDPIIKRTVSCRYCCKKLSYKAVRCVYGRLEYIVYVGSYFRLIRAPGTARHGKTVARSVCTDCNETTQGDCGPGSKDHSNQFGLICTSGRC